MKIQLPANAVLVPALIAALAAPSSRLLVSPASAAPPPLVAAASAADTTSPYMQKPIDALGGLDGLASKLTQSLALPLPSTDELGKKAGELKAIKDADQHAYDAVIDGAQWKRYVMTLRAKVATYNDVSKLKVHIFRASPVN